MDDEFLTVAEVAALLKLNPQTVRNWIDRGELPASRVGRRVRIRRADVDAKVAAGATVKPSDAERDRFATASAAVAQASRKRDDDALAAALDEMADAAIALAAALRRTNT